MIHEIAKKNNMETLNYCYKHDDNFLNNHDLPCYIPENADDIDDVFTKNDIKNEVIEWLNTIDAKEYLKYSYGFLPEYTSEFINGWVQNVYEILDWQYPSTLLNDYTQ